MSRGSRAAASTATDHARGMQKNKRVTVVTPNDDTLEGGGVAAMTRWNVATARTPTLMSVGSVAWSANGSTASMTSVAAGPTAAIVWATAFTEGQPKRIESGRYSRGWTVKMDAQLYLRRASRLH